MELKEFLQSRFDKSHFIEFISDRFYGFSQNLIDDKYLGKVKLDDKSEIGFFIFKENENKDIENSRVGFHNELKKYADEHLLDGALGAFYNLTCNAWRLSFIRFSYDDNNKKLFTNQKRFTFVLGNNKTKTAYEQLKNVKYPKILELEKAFSVEAVTKDFYKGLVKEYEKLLNEYLVYPLTKDSSKKEFAIRLIGRILFIKFLNKKSLVPDSIFEVSNGYYHKKLEPLFFEQLNTPKSERKEEFSSDSIPFLNGGLFEPLKDLDCYEWNGVCSSYINTLKIDDRFFTELYEHLNQYNFTIDENSIEDSDLSIDPEMLGRIFENLLAEINPETSQNARKSTGSYYTPREIVEYMVSSSLLEYLKTKTFIDEETLKTIIFKNEEPKNDYDKVKVLSAIFELKILDPACGSGAFPMGLLQKIVKILNLIDEDASIWFGLQNKEFREVHKNRNKDYIRKLSIIKNTIYGIDIQPIAIEISKLRFFLSLIVDEDGEPEPLPNLEFKFVCANSLLPLQKDVELDGLFNNNTSYSDTTSGAKKYFELENELIDVKSKYFVSTGKDKLNLKHKYEDIQKQMFNEIVNNRTIKVSNNLIYYDPFDPLSVAPFFDSDFMFNIKEGFDIVIGNPPYLRVQGIDKIESGKYKTLYTSATGSYDLYVIFTERAIKLLNQSGMVNFIMPHKWVNSAFGKGLREFTKDKFYKFISFREYQVFNASTYTSLVWFKNKSETVKYIGVDKDLNTNNDLRYFLDGITEDKYTITKNEKLNNDAWTFSDNKVVKVLAKIDEQHLRVSDVFSNIQVGIQTMGDDIYFFDGEFSDNYFSGVSKQSVDKILLEKDIIKPLLMGDDVKKYSELKPSKFVIYPHQLDENGKTKPIDEEKFKIKYPLAYAYLKNFKTYLVDKKIRYKTNSQYWYALHCPRQMAIFEQEKIITPEISLGCNMSLDISGLYSNTQNYSMVKNIIFKESYKFYLAILNSKLIWWYVQQTGTTLANGYFRFKTNYLEPIPLPKMENIEDAKPFEMLVDYVMFLKALPNEQKIDEYVSNEHIAKQFEEVIDGMVFELYFTDEFKAKNIEFIKYAKEDFRPIEHLDDISKQKVIKEAYLKLCETKNPIRNNLLLLPIEFDFIRTIFWS